MNENLDLDFGLLFCGPDFGRLVSQDIFLAIVSHQNKIKMRKVTHQSLKSLNLELESLWVIKLS